MWALEFSLAEESKLLHQLLIRNVRSLLALHDRYWQERVF